MQKEILFHVAKINAVPCLTSIYFEVKGHTKYTQKTALAISEKAEVGKGKEREGKGKERTRKRRGNMKVVCNYL